MNGKILPFPQPMREVPTQEIRSIYEYLYREQLRKQSLEHAMIQLHERMNPPEGLQEEFDYRTWWKICLVLYGGIGAFLLGYLVGGK